MLIIDRRFTNEMQKREFITECENDFLRMMESLTSSILENGDMRVVTLSGPTCSGKTVTAERISRAVEKAGRRMIRISIDDYYRDRSELIAEAEREGRAPDYDSAGSIDLRFLEKNIDGICNKAKVDLPRYDFKTGSRSDVVTVDSSKYDLVLFEGIQAVYPEVTSMFGHYPYVSIATDVRSGICTNGRSFDAREVRLMRRLVRDVHARNTPPERTFKLWATTVIPNEEKNILPYSGTADIKIDSLMPYEIHVIRDPLIETLSRVPKDDEYYLTAEDLIRRVTPIEPIDRKYIPCDSLYREFIGDGN
ncbi:MAG: hypothetical protein IJC50_06855 [Clostridia bacterium]|nr:hypothetical protein [Clostridia bacterium]